MNDGNFVRIDPMPDSEILLDVRNLRIRYITEGAVSEAVNGISFQVRKGETLGLVGETGAGKTTTALSLLRLLPPFVTHMNADGIYFDHRDIMKLSEQELRDLRGEHIAMIFQDPMTSLNPVIPVGKQVEEVLWLHNKEKLSRAEIRERVERILEMVGIPCNRKHEYPHQFSGGMKQRITIAIALACKPRLLIADEPTTALDVTIQAQVLEKIEELKREFDTSMILITHDLGIVAQTCDDVAIMYAGEIIEKGTVYDLFESPDHHPYTSGLFNSIPKIDEDSEELQPIKGLMPNPADLPAGCNFAPRCPFKMPACEVNSPPIYEEGTHSISCLLFKNRWQKEGV